MPTVGKISINLTAGTAQFNADMDKASAKIREFGSHGVSSVQATSAALRTLEGGVTNNLRAAERFLATTLGLGNALKAAFPVFGAIALGGVVFELVGKLGEAYKAIVKLQEAPKRIGQEFQAIVQPIRVANDELAVANDRLGNDIAKLQGKPQNGLKLALDEARLSADKLAESLNRDLQEVQKLLEQEQIGSLKGLVTGNAATGDLTSQFKQFREKLTDISIETSDQLAKTSDQKQQASIFEQATNRRKAAIESETAFLKQQLAVSEQLQSKRNNPASGKVVGVIGGVAIPSNGAPTPADQSARISELKGQIDSLQQLLVNFNLSQANAKLTGTKTKLEDAASNARLDQPVRDKISELKAQLQQAKSEASAAGTDPFTEALAKGAGEASKAIADLNNHLAERKQKGLSLGNISEITALETSIALTQLQTKVRDEAEKKQQEMQAGADKIALDIQEENEKRDENLTILRQQSDAALALADAEKKGAEAVFQAQLKIKLASIKDPSIRLATQIRDEDEHAAKIAGTVAQIDRETAATKRLADAVLGGEKAKRQAELDNIRNSGASPDEIEAKIKAQKAQYQLQDAVKLDGLPASAGVQAYFTEMVDEAQSAALQVKQALGSAFDGLNDNLSRILTGQKANWGSFLQGLGQQISKMVLQTAEANVAKRLGSVFEKQGSGGVWDEKPPAGVGGVFGKLGGILGGGAKRDGSTQASALFVQIAGVGSNAGQFGLPGGKPGLGGDANLSSDDLKNLGDFNNSELGQLAGNDSEDGNGGKGSGGIFGTLSGILGKLGGSDDGGDSSDDGSGGALGTIGGILGKLFGGFRADGGDVDPGHAYMVGERGPEIWTPPSRGNIIPNNKLGGAVYYNIDARGTDPVLTEQRTRAAIVAAHQSAVVTAAKVQSESAKRKPH